MTTSTQVGATSTTMFQINLITEQIESGDVNHIGTEKREQWMHISVFVLRFVSRFHHRSNLVREG